RSAPRCGSAPRRRRLCRRSRCRGTSRPSSPPSIRFSPVSNNRGRMRIRNWLSVIGMLGTLTGMAVVSAGAQDSAAALDQQVRMRMMIEQITRNRPPEAEQAARDMVRRLQLLQTSLDSLRAHSLDQYWQEVAQLTVQREQLNHAPDSLRAQMLVQ